MTPPAPNERPIRALLIAEAANPEMTSVPLEGWSHSRAIAGMTPALTVTQVRNAAAFARAGVPGAEYRVIDSEAVARPLWRLGTALRGGAGRGWTTVVALNSLSYAYFERVVWRELGPSIRRGEFDVVHRLTPLTPTTPSSLATRCERAGVPFVLGPLNGGVPWPPGFDSARRREREWLSYVRSAYRLLPGYRSTRLHAAALICGSQDTLGQMPTWCRDRCVYIPENAVDPARFIGTPSQEWRAPLRVVFVGRLVPYKGADMLLEAAGGLLRDGRVTVEIVGDGPEREPLKALAGRLGITRGLTFHGWVPHAELHTITGKAHVFGFPSVREFGGAVVLEAMLMGVVPLVVAYGGPAELITPRTGIGVPIGPRSRIIEAFRGHLERLAGDPAVLAPMSAAGRAMVLRDFTWEAKARQVIEVYRWVLGRRPDRPVATGGTGAGSTGGV